MKKYKTVSLKDLKKYDIEPSLYAIESYYYKLNNNKKYPLYSICLYRDIKDPTVVNIVCSKKESKDHWMEDYGIPLQMISKVNKMLLNYKKMQKEVLLPFY